MGALLCNEVRNERIIALRDEGITYDAIAAEMNVSRNVVSGVLKRAGKTDTNAPQSYKVPRERVSQSYKNLVISAYQAGRTRDEVSKEYGFCTNSISLWSRQAGNGRKSYKLTPYEVSEIRRLRAEGVRLKDLADKFGVHITQVSRTARGLCHG